MNTINPWNEEKLTALNAPEISGPTIGALNQTLEDTFVEVDVTAVISGDGFYSFGISKTTRDKAEYSTKEGDKAPELIVETGAVVAKQAPDSTSTEDADVEAAPEQLPHRISLSPNYPNPFNAGTTIEYALPKAAKVELAIYNIKGQQVRQLVQGLQQPGHKKLTWNGKDNRGKDISSGVYFLRLMIDNQHFSRKLLLQK